MPRKPFYPDDWEGSFGVPVEQHTNVSLGNAGDYQSMEEISSGEGVT